MEAAAVAEAVDPQKHVPRRRPLLLAGRRGRRTVVVPEVSLHRLRCRAGERTHNSKGGGIPEAGLIDPNGPKTMRDIM